MTKPLAFLAAAAFLTLAACTNSEPSNTPEAADDGAAANTVANTAPVVLPPAIRAEVTMRCKDNSLAHFVFMEGDTMLRVRSPKDADAVVMNAAKAGDPYTADGGWSVTGDERTVTIAQPGKSEQTCKA